MAGSKEGKAGCGCLLFVVIICLALAALLVHPLPLRVLTGLLVYQDKVVPSDACLVPRFLEDKHGELYQEAFKEFWAGDCKVIYVEDDDVLGVSVKEIVARMAKQRGIKDDIIKKAEIRVEDGVAVTQVKERLAQLGVKRGIFVVPEYASRRFHLLFGSEGANQEMIFLIKPISMSYFKREKWWANQLSRTAVEHELYGLGSIQVSRFKYGQGQDLKEDNKKR